MIIKRLYYHYTLWEDYKHGLYENNKGKDNIDKGAELLGSERLYEAMLDVLYHRPISSNENLTNNQQNRQAYLGQASCCLKYGLSRDSTIKARGKLTKEQQKRANKIADMVIKLFETKYLIKHYSLFTYDELCQ